MNPDIAIIGAGMAGLACARTLVRAGYQPLVLDKSRGVGGRMATRRVTLDDNAISFDHGAQYLTARDPGFATAIADLGAACVRWDDGSAAPHLVGVPGMSSLARAMADGLDLRLNTQVTAARRHGSGWELAVGETRIRTDHLVITVPAPQAAALVGPDHALHAPLARIAMVPCLTLLAAFPAAAPRPFVSRAAADQPLAWIAQDSSKPGRADTLTSWVAQAGAAWSAARLEESAPEIAARMLPMLAEALGVDGESALYSAAHRWRYARAVTPLGVPFLVGDEGRLHIGGDWCLGPNIEAAWRSGSAIADAIIAQGVGP